MSKIPGMAKPTMRNRTVKVTDELWDAAHAKADRQQESVSDKIREALQAYVDEPDQKQR